MSSHDKEMWKEPSRVVSPLLADSGHSENRIQSSVYFINNLYTDDIFPQCQQSDRFDAIEMVQDLPKREDLN